MCQNTGRLAAEKQAFQSAPTVRGHDDKVAPSALGRLQDTFRGIVFNVQRRALDVQSLREPCNRAKGLCGSFTCGLLKASKGTATAP
jgi:hypothetical protein